MFNLSDTWGYQDPPAKVGVLAVKNAPNCEESPALSSAREELEGELRDRFGHLDRNGIRALPVFAAYESHYKRFKKTYHVQLQLESVVLKGKPIFSPSALVGAMFMAELKTGLLTAAHDLKSLEVPLSADIARGEESYLRLDGTHQLLKAGDLYIRDQAGVLSSVIYGPDFRTRIQKSTDQAVYTTYALGGISPEQVLEELEILEGYIRLFAPNLKREVLAVY